MTENSHDSVIDMYRKRMSSNENGAVFYIWIGGPSCEAERVFADFVREVGTHDIDSESEAFFKRLRVLSTSLHNVFPLASILTLHTFEDESIIASSDMPLTTLQAGISLGEFAQTRGIVIDSHREPRAMALAQLRADEDAGLERLIGDLDI